MAESADRKLPAARAAAPRGCPVDRVFSTFSETYVANPYAVLEKLRGYSELAEVCRKPEILSAENVQDPVLPICDAAAEILADVDYDPITALSNRSPAVFVGAIAHPRPSETIFRFIVFPEADDKVLKDWTTNRLAFT